MRKSTIAIVALVVALVGSNVFWFYAAIDGGVSYAYLEHSYRTARSTAQQALALLPVAANPNSTQQDFLAVVQKMDPGEPFEKEGFIWVGSLGLRFDAGGRLAEATSNVDRL